MNEEASSWGFLLMHRAIRKDIHRIVEASAQLEGGDGAAIERFRRWIEFLWMMIEHHHENEDGLMFPLIRELDATFDPSPFEAEHRDLHGAVTALFDSIDALPTAGREPLIRASERFHDLLTSHLEREEAQCANRIDRLFTPAYVKRLERESAKKTPMRILTKLLPWMMSAATEAECSAIDARLPWTIRALNALWWRRSYSRAAMTP